MKVYKVFQRVCASLDYKGKVGSKTGEVFNCKHRPFLQKRKDYSERNRLGNQAQEPKWAIIKE